MKNKWTIKDYKQALLLAGALAKSCEDLQNSGWGTLKIRMDTMINCLYNYNEFIFKERKQEVKK
jgi:hypothetical protein